MVHVLVAPARRRVHQPGNMGEHSE